MSNVLTGQDLANFVISKVNTPYVYGAKGADGIFTSRKFISLKNTYPRIFTTDYIRKIANMNVIDNKICTDCSGLISWYTGKALCSSQLYSTAYTRLPINKLEDFAIGTVLYKTGHVGVYVGKDSQGRPLCTEARGIDYGTVCAPITNPSRWTSGLTFSWMDYDIAKPIEDKTWKGTNPYAKPSGLIRKGMKGDAVRWLQWELNEAGFDKAFSYNGKVYTKVKIDGDFGIITESALKLFQQSCKIKVDGICGDITRKCLLIN